MQRVNHFRARRAESFGRAVKVKTVPCLILNLPVIKFAAQGRRAGNPAASGSIPTISEWVLRNLPNQGFSVTFRHPITRLDLNFLINPRLKSCSSSVSRLDP